MLKMQTSTHYGYNLPESGDPADISKISENFNKIDTDLYEVAQMVSMDFDRLAETYGYTFTKQTNENNTVFTETVKSGSPVTAIRVTTKSFVDSVLQFRKQIIIGENVTFFTEKKTADGWEGVVG